MGTDVRLTISARVIVSRAASAAARSLPASSVGMVWLVTRKLTMSVTVL